MTALSGEKTLAELSAEFGVHPTMISGWKQELVTRAGELFARSNKAPAVADVQKVIDDLHRKIGQLQVERDKPRKTPCRFPHLAQRSAAAHKLHSTPQQHRMILISGSDQTSSRLPGPFSLFLPGSCPNNRNRCSITRHSTSRGWVRCLQ